MSSLFFFTFINTILHTRPECSVAQRKRVGLITQRSSDRNRVEQSFCFLWEMLMHLLPRCHFFLHVGYLVSFVKTSSDGSMISDLATCKAQKTSAYLS